MGRGGDGSSGDETAGEGMKSRPVLFSAPMVRALLEARKTQTRRIIKPQPDYRLSHIGFECGSDRAIFAAVHRHAGPVTETSEERLVKCPYGKPGDLLWVRESGKIDQDSKRIFIYSATPGVCHVKDLADNDDYHTAAHAYKSTPSIHMPRWASRLTLQLIDVRVERLQNITEEDAKAEGVWRCPVTGFFGSYQDSPAQDTAVLSYRDLWESINGSVSWVENPWAWVLEFKVHRCNVDAFQIDAA